MIRIPPIPIWCVALAALVMPIAPSSYAQGVSFGGLMQHVTINVGPPVDGQFPLMATFDEDPGEGLGMVLGADDLAAPFDVLSGRAYNAQFGWLRQGIWGPGAGEGAFIQLVDQSPGLSVYQGAFGVDTGGTGQSDTLNGAHTLAPILGTDGSPDYWQWDGRMTHNWYVSDVAGPHFATYDLFVAEVLPDGRPGALSSLYLPGRVTLTWIDDITPAAFLAGDYDGNGFVSQSDLDLVLLNWGATTLPDGWIASDQFDGQQISQNELDGVLLNWGSGQSPPSFVVPEPFAAAGLAWGLLMFGLRRPRNQFTGSRAA